jgi:hypothetical protein
MTMWDLIEPHWDRLNDAKCDTDAWARAVSTGPDEVVELFSARWCFAEVGNGGLLQFFSNSSGIVAGEAVEGLRRIGMPEAAQHLRTAMQLVGEPYISDREERNARLDALCPEDEEEDPFEVMEEALWERLAPEDGQDFESRADAWVASL